MFLPFNPKELSTCAAPPGCTLAIRVKRSIIIKQLNFVLNWLFWCKGSHRPTHQTGSCKIKQNATTECFYLEQQNQHLVGLFEKLNETKEMKTDSHSDDESQTISHSTPSHFHWVIDNTLGAFFDSEAFTAAIGPKTPRPKADRNHNTKIKSRTFKCCFNLYIYSCFNP